MATLPARHLALVFACGCLAFLICLYPLSATLVNGRYLPADADSFYHARRILDALATPWHVAPFDPYIHAPEGSWSPIPWAYDTLMALIGSGARALGRPDPLAVLVYVAPLCVFLNVALVYGIARQLRMGTVASLVAALCFAVSPLTQSLHRVGMLDHHFVEQAFVLATLHGTLAWLGAPAGRGPALRLGILLGAAPAFHAGLFILQLPLLLCAAQRWWRGHPLPVGSTQAFGATLVATTLVFLLPSGPFQAGEFTFGLQSWFHAYVAAATALALVVLARVPARPATLAGGLAASLLMAVPLMGEMGTALGFLGGTSYGVGAMGEMHGVLDYLREGNTAYLLAHYGAALGFAPLALLAVAALAWRDAGDSRPQVLATFGVFGFTLLLLQFRLHYFGAIFLYLPLLYLADRTTGPRRKAAIGGAVALLALAQVPALATLRMPPPPGGSADYALTRAMFGPIHEACRRAPGVLLADANDGHYLRFHADCPTIASNLLLSARDSAKARQAEELMRATVATVRREAPYVRYLYVRRNDNFYASECGVACPENRGLRQALLGDTLPPEPGLRLLAELRLPVAKGRTAVVARFFALAPVDDMRPLHAP